MKKIIFLFLSIFMLTGCAKLGNLLTLKSLADNQTAQQKYVGEKDRRFQRLLEALKTPDFKEDFPDQESLRRAFGDPIFTESVQKGDRTLEEWLYRYATKLQNSEKVYLYFDGSGKLVDVEHVSPKEKTQGESHAPAEEAKI